MSTNSSSKNRIHAIVVGDLWPGRNLGYEFALESSLQLYSNIFEKVTYLGFTERPVQDQVKRNLAEVHFIHVPYKKPPKWNRFLRGLFTSLPAVAIWKWNRIILQEHAQRLIQEAKFDGARPLLIVEGTPFASQIPHFQAIEPSLPVFIRTHELLTTSFAGLDRVTPFPQNLAWKLESAKIRRFEKRVLGSADRVFTITESDEALFLKTIGVTTHGVLGVSIPEEITSGIPQGDPHTLLYFGSVDLRKGAGLKNFLELGWPLVREAVPDARFILAGHATNELTDASRGVLGEGFVASSSDHLARGAIFINPQWIGGGVKIKSLIALQAGKALVSTLNGVEGLPGKSGTHYCADDDPVHLAQHIIRLMTDQGERDRIILNGKSFFRKHYSWEAFQEQAGPIVQQASRLTEISVTE